MSGEVAATWSSEPLNALECDPDRSSPELSVRDELRPESDLSAASAYGVAAVMAFTLDVDDDDDEDEEDDDDKDCCRSFDGNAEPECALLDAGTPAATAAGYCR